MTRRASGSLYLPVLKASVVVAVSVATLIGLVAGLAGDSIAAPIHTLKPYQARGTAESEAFDYQMTRGLDSNKVRSCRRSAPRRIVCAATVVGETGTAIRTCKLQIAVRAVYRVYAWDEVATVVSHRCLDQAKPLLTYAAALAAIQAEGDRFAGQRTTVTYMHRRDDLTFSGTASWQRPATSPNEFFPNEKCSVELVATLGATLTVAIDGFHCF